MRIFRIRQWNHLKDFYWCLNLRMRMRIFRIRQWNHLDAFIFRFGEKVTHCETCQPQFMSHCSSFLLGSCEDKAIIFLGWETDNKDRWSRWKPRFFVWFKVIELRFVTSVLVWEKEKQDIATVIKQGEHARFGEYGLFNVYLWKHTLPLVDLLYEVAFRSMLFFKLGIWLSTKLERMLSCVVMF